MWKLALTDTLTMTEHGDMTAGEAEQIFARAIQVGIPHGWDEVRPDHCPACLNAYLVTMLVTRGNADGLEAARLIAETKWDELQAFLTYETDPAIPGESSELAPEPAPV